MIENIMYKKDLGIFLIISGVLSLLAWLFFRKKRKHRIDPLETEFPFLASMTHFNVAMGLVGSIIFLILGISLLLDQ